MFGDIPKITAPQIIVKLNSGVLIRHEKIDIPIIVKIPEAGSSADHFPAADAHLLSDFSEGPILIISIQPVLRTGDDKQVQITLKIQIGEQRRPLPNGRVRPDSGSNGDIPKGARTAVMV